MQKTDILIIGGSAAGLVTALTARSEYSQRKITIIRKEKQAMVPCAIPHTFNTLNGTDNNIISTEPLSKNDIDLVFDEVISVDLEKKICETKTGQEFSFEKLVFVTGSSPILPKIKGINKKHVFSISKFKTELDKARKATREKKSIVVIGGGFIGVELADELKKAGKKSDTNRKGRIDSFKFF